MCDTNNDAIDARCTRIENRCVYRSCVDPFRGRGRVCISAARED